MPSRRKKGENRPDTQAGTRFREWLKETYGSVGGGAARYELATASLTPYFKGDSELGAEWAKRNCFELQNEQKK